MAQKALDSDAESSSLLGRNIEPPSDKYNKLSAFFVFFFPALGGLLFGFDIGATSAVITQLQSSSYSGTTWYETVADSSFLQGVITSVGMLGAMLGSMTCFAVADDLGRRRSLLLASSLFFTGAMIEFLSGKASWSADTGIAVLIIGRLVYGYACGFAMHGAPAYIGEMAPSAIRGLLVSLKEAFIVLGMVVGYAIGYAYSERDGGWRITYLWACPFAFLMFCGMVYLPYSARWLALKGRINEARQSLKWVEPDIKESAVDAIREAAEKAAESQADTDFTADYKRLTGELYMFIFPSHVNILKLIVLLLVFGPPPPPEPADL